MSRPQDYSDAPQREKGNDDPFLRIAITFILGVVIGFTLVLMGFIFLVLAGLSAIEASNEFPAWGWLLLGIASEIIGVWMMRKSLEGSPTPGSIDPRTASRGPGAETKSREEVDRDVDSVFGGSKKEKKES